MGEPVSAPVSVIDGESCGLVPGGRAMLLGRACGLAAGTLLACGSVLAGATHVGDGSLAEGRAPLLKGTPVVPGVDTSALGDYRASESAGHMSVAPEMVSAQAVTAVGPASLSQIGPVRRNTPVSWGMAAEPTRSSSTAQQSWASSSPPAGHAPSGLIAPTSPVLDPASNGVSRVLPVGRALAPANPHQPRMGEPRHEQAGRFRDQPAGAARGERTGLPTAAALAAAKHVVAPVDSVVKPATQPAMTMLTSLLPGG
ncbi:MAG: hypothetical protein JO115_14400 [Pseudonocardiales bacterium]|nr:hypothetical protein [Pseudonocardiales bacterium]